MKTLTASALALCFVSAAQAADVSVRYSLQPSANHGPLLRGSIEVAVSNTSKAALRNVDLRLAQPGPRAMEKTVLQLGTIPAGETRIGKASFMLDAAFQASGAPLPWRVDYDTGGTHHQVVVPGIQTRR
jgi:hypothetical protein